MHFPTRMSEQSLRMDNNLNFEGDGRQISCAISHSWLAIEGGCPDAELSHNCQKMLKSLPEMYDVACITQYHTFPSNGARGCMNFMNKLIHTVSRHVHVTFRMYEYNQCSYILFFENLRKPYVHVTFRMYEYNQCSYILFFESLQQPYFGISWKVEAKFFSLNIRYGQKFQTGNFL